MRALVIKPHWFSNPGTIAEYADELGVGLVHHVASDGGPLPPLDGFDLVLVMGAPWSVYGEEVKPWIGGQLRLIRQAVDRQVPVFGVCFGAQAFAKAFGAKVFKAERSELGWGRVESLAPDAIPEGPWFMWHSDAFTLPEGARLLAKTDVSPQAYSLGPHLLVQFHPEVTPEIVRVWMDHDVTDFERNGVDPAAVLEETERRKHEAREKARGLFDRFMERAKARA